MIIQEDSPNVTEIASDYLKNGKVICFATETVYALACDARSDIAVSSLYQIKKRDPKKPIAVFVKNLTIAKKFLRFSSLENKIAESFMPGMITLILQKKLMQDNHSGVSLLLNECDDSLGLRIPNHKFCLELLDTFGGIVAVTSANISNMEPAVSFAEAKECFQNKVDLIIDGGICLYKIASTVLEVKKNEIKILREGLITKNQINNLL